MGEAAERMQLRCTVRPSPLASQRSASNCERALGGSELHLEAHVHVELGRAVLLQLVVPVQGYLAHKKQPPPPRTTMWPWA